MFNLKRKLAVAMSGVLTLAMLAPAVAVPNVAKAADDKGPTQIENVTFSEGATAIKFSSQGTYYLDTMKGETVKDTTVYKKVKSIDLSFLNGKAADLVLYQDDRDNKQIKIKVEAQNKKVKASYNAGEKKLEVKNNGTAVESGYEVKIGADYIDDIKDIEFSKYYKKGATGYVWIPGNGGIDSEAASTAAITLTPASKEAKFKIPAQKKGPSVKIDVETVSFKVGKGCEWSLYNGGDDPVATGTAIDNKATTVNLVDEASKASINLETASLTLEVIKSATAKAPESKATVVKVPTMAGVDAVKTTSDGGIEMEATYNKNGDTQTGVQIKNYSKTDTYQVALVDDPSKVSLTPATKADKIKWTKIAPDKTAKFGAAKCKDKYLIVRIAGSKATKTASMKLPSQIRKGDIKIAVTDKIKDDVTLEVSKTETVTGDASGAAVKATAKDGGTLIAVVADKQVKAVSLKLTQSDVRGTTLTSGEAAKIAVAAKKFIVVYEFDSEGKCTHFACKKVTSDMIY